MTRREALQALAGSAGLLLAGVRARAAEAVTAKTKMGIVTYALGIHQKNHWGGRHPGLSPALALLEESHELGAAGIQVDLGAADAANTTELRDRAERYSMYIEASISPPQSKEDISRFEKDVRSAKACGASLARTVIMPGRRYEQFKSLAEFRSFEHRGLQSLRWAEPVLKRHKFRLAVENHKDQRVPERLATLKHLSSEYIGVCVDVGNSFTLLEDPMEVARAYAPWAFTVHFKDQAVRENPQGFWFADVALGDGFLDLPALVNVLRGQKPNLHFNLETISRDPLNVPIFTNDFWVTMPDTPAYQLSRTLRVLKTQYSAKPFVQVSDLPLAQQLAFESDNVRRSLAYAREKLGMG